MRPAPGHAHVEALGSGALVDQDDGGVDGQALRFVDGHGVGQGDLLPDVVARQDHLPPPGEVLHQQGVVAVAGQYLPAVPVAHPGAGPYLGAKLSVASFSALERSAWNPSRIKVFSADELLALSRGFDLPIGFFFVPPPPAKDIGLHVPNGGAKGVDPIVMLDALLGATHNLAYLESELLDYSASIAPMPRSKKEKPSVSPADLAERLTPLMAMRAKAGLRSSFGDIGQPGRSWSDSPSCWQIWTRRHQASWRTRWHKLAPARGSSGRPRPRPRARTEQRRPFLRAS